MSLYTMYAFGLLAAFFLGSVWSFWDPKKPPTVKEFLAKLLARAMVLFVIIVIIVGFFALVQGFLSAQT